MLGRGVNEPTGMYENEYGSSSSLLLHRTWLYYIRPHVFAVLLFVTLTA